MEYVGRVGEGCFSAELYSLVERFEALLSEICDFASSKRVCSFSNDSSYVFHAGEVFVGQVSFSSDGVVVSVQLNPEDPVLALVKYSRSPKKYMRELDDDFDRFVGEYRRMGKIMEEIVRF